MKLVNILAMSTSAVLILSGCGAADTDEKETQLDKVDSKLNSEKDIDKIKPQKSQKPFAKVAPTAWDTALAFDDYNMGEVFFIENPEFLDSRDFIRFITCFNLGRSKYNDLAKNEFSFEDILSEHKDKAAKRITAFKTENNLSSDKPYQFKVQWGATIGKYDFDKEEFEFSPLTPYSALTGSNDMFWERSCYDSTGSVEKPSAWPRNIRVIFRNKEAIRKLVLQKADAKILIDQMTEDGNSSRSVKFKFIFEFSPEDMKFVNKQGYKNQYLEVKANVIQAKVISEKYDSDIDGYKVIAEYPETYFNGK